MQTAAIYAILNVIGALGKWRTQEGATLKKMYAALENLVWVTQLGLSLLLPLVCCMALAFWMTVHWGVGGWIFVPAVLLGLATGAATFRRFAQMWLRRIQKEQRPPAGFNRH